MVSSINQFVFECFYATVHIPKEGKIMMMHNIKDLEKRIGRQLKALRVREGLKQFDVAEAAGLSVPTISNLESGRGSSLSSFFSVLTAMGTEAWAACFACHTTDIHERERLMLLHDRLLSESHYDDLKDQHEALLERKSRPAVGKRKRKL
jgi:transcriptional regulator with XRE-family HTH domain